MSGRNEAIEIAEMLSVTPPFEDLGATHKSLKASRQIYLVTSVAPIPMSTMMNHEWSQMGQNYLRSLFALAFQGFLIIVCVAIYAVLVQNMVVESDISMAIWTVMGYTVLLCFTLFKTSSLAKSVFNAH